MYKLSVKLTDEEGAILKEKATKSGLSVSKYTKKALFDSIPSDTWRKALPIVADMTTNLNKYKYYKEDKYIDSIAKGLSELWLLSK